MSASRFYSIDNSVAMTQHALEDKNFMLISSSYRGLDLTNTVAIFCWKYQCIENPSYMVTGSGTEYDLATVATGADIIIMLKSMEDRLRRYEEEYQSDDSDEDNVEDSD